MFLNPQNIWGQFLLFLLENKPQFQKDKLGERGHYISVENDNVYIYSISIRYTHGHM